MHPLHGRTTRRTGALATGALLLALAGCPGAETDNLGPKTFPTPEAAAEALFEALESHDVDATLRIFGRKYEQQLVTPDWDAEGEARQRIVTAGREKLLVEGDGEEVQLVLGSEEWSLPMPLVRANGAWRFDTAEGIEVIIDRRVGRNELSAIAVARAYVDAQIEYAIADRDGDQVLEYAQRLASTPGNRDGLYWEAGPDEETSPFGPLVQRARRYLETTEPGDPLRGYYFKILTKQGENPPGGRHDYVINGNMIAGFSLVAFPADYGNSGVMTFVVSHRGEVYQKDLGAIAGLDEYDPDDTWTVVKELEL